MRRGILSLVVLLGAASVSAAKPITINGELDGKPISGTVERIKLPDGRYVVEAKLDNGMTGRGTKLGSMWKITVRPPAKGGAVGLRGKLAGEDGKAGEASKPVTLLLTAGRRGIDTVLYRDGENVGSADSRRTRPEPKPEPTTSKDHGGTKAPQLVRFKDFDQRLGQPAKPSTMPTPIDVNADAVKMEETLQRTIRRMNARGERFDHPIPFLSGLWGNTLYKYQKTGSFTDAPFGALFDRLYNENGRYRNVKECYDQAETVLGELKKAVPTLSTGGWEFGMASQPGHYWAVARIDLSKVPNTTRTGFMFVHMDPWKDSFDIEYGKKDSVEFSPRF